MMTSIKAFLKLESASGIVLMAVAALAMLAANSPLSAQYEALTASSVSFWVNDGLMAIFFLVVGAEIKQEMVEGELATWRQAMLPVAGAIGGVALPAIIYSIWNWGTPDMRGWAVASATDIAFSLGVLALLGNRVSRPLKLFLMSVAVIDDLIAVTIIALFYTDHISLPYMGAVLGCIMLLVVFNRFRVVAIWPYMLVGAIMWGTMLQSGVHPTIAGVLLGLIVPLPVGKRLIHALHAWVAFGIIPLFAFMNGGIALAGITIAKLANPITGGIALGLFIGKQAGIFMTASLLVRLRFAKLPAQATWMEFYAVCMIAGIGFTMSLFIGALAFTQEAQHIATRLGVITGSLLSALMGYGTMRLAFYRKSL